jgi:hypothetical protein
MKKIQLIVMGRLEHRALAGALERAMWGEVADPPRVTNALPTETNEPASKTPDGGMRTIMLKLVDEVIKLLLGRGVAPVSDDTLLLIVGDMEMYYLDRPHELMNGFGEVMNERLATLSDADQTFVRGALSERCSYHLFRPMVEALFFGDPQALSGAGVAAKHPPLLKRQDVEEFESVDPLFLIECQRENRFQYDHGATWWRHERHPKGYLTHLARRPGSLGYNEAHRGAIALRGLCWGTVIGTQPSPFLRALFEDLADWLGLPSPLGPPDLALPPPPTALGSAPDRLLRNLTAPLGG